MIDATHAVSWRLAIHFHLFLPISLAKHSHTALSNTWQRHQVNLDQLHMNSECVPVLVQLLVASYITRERWHEQGPPWVHDAVLSPWSQAWKAGYTFRPSEHRPGFYHFTATECSPPTDASPCNWSLHYITWWNVFWQWCLGVPTLPGVPTVSEGALQCLWCTVWKDWLFYWPQNGYQGCMAYVGIKEAILV